MEENVLMDRKQGPTPEEFKNEMKKILEQYYDDEELFHVVADEYICDVMKALGFEEGIQIFENAHKWYS